MSYAIYLLQSPMHRLLKRTLKFGGRDEAGCHDDAGCVPLAIFLPSLLLASHLLHSRLERRTALLPTKTRLPA